MTADVRTIRSIRFLFIVPFGVLAASMASAAGPDAKEMIGRWEYLASVDRITDVSTYTMFIEDNDPSTVFTPP